MHLLFCFAILLGCTKIRSHDGHQRAHRTPICPNRRRFAPDWLQLRLFSDIDAIAASEIAPMD